MRRWRSKLARVAVGGVLFGFLQGVGGISYNDVLFEFLLRWISVIVGVLFGGDTSSLTNSGTGSVG